MSEKLSVISVETNYLNAVTEGDKKLKQEKNSFLLQNLKSALADATHHLYWLQHRNKIEEESQKKISKIVFIEPSHELNLVENKKKHSDATAALKEELNKLKDESRKLQAQKES